MKRNIARLKRNLIIPGHFFQASKIPTLFVTSSRHDRQFLRLAVQLGQYRSSGFWGEAEGTRNVKSAKLQPELRRVWTGWGPWGFLRLGSGELSEFQFDTANVHIMRSDYQLVNP